MCDFVGKEVCELWFGEREKSVSIIAEKQVLTLVSASRSVVPATTSISLICLDCLERVLTGLLATDQPTAKREWEI